MGFMLSKPEVLAKHLVDWSPNLIFYALAADSARLPFLSGTLPKLMASGQALGERGRTMAIFR
tara:strand:+ start:317 stop:505 length:189 start_codon:yes stop_codon:yes gene_type:complete